MKQKYIITLQSVPYHDSKGNLRWDATEFNTLSFDEVGLERLEPYDKKLKELEEENRDMKKEVDILISENGELASRAHRAEDKVEELKKDRDSYHDLYTELSKTYDKLSAEKRKLNARTDCLREEVLWYRKHFKEQSDKIQELKKELDELTSQYQKLTVENKRLQNSVRSGYDQGQTDLWVKLQDVNNSQPFELTTCFPDVTGVEDILNWDLEDFLDAYKKWYEEKEHHRIDHMRDHLKRFCYGRSCCGCPLNSDEFKCGTGLGFKPLGPSDNKIISDEEVKKYYEKVREFELFTRRLPQPWECTLEGTIEINGDLLAKVCGVKIDDDK